MDIKKKYKCEWCGGELPDKLSSGIVKCPYCGSKTNVLLDVPVETIEEMPLCPKCEKNDRVYQVYDLYNNKQSKFKDILHFLAPPENTNAPGPLDGLSAGEHPFFRKKAPARAWVALIIGLVWLLIDISFRTFASSVLSKDPNPTTFGGIPVNEALWDPYYLFQGWLCPGVFLLWAVIEFIAVGMNNREKEAQFQTARLEREQQQARASKQKILYRTRYQVWKNLYYCDRNRCVFLKTAGPDKLENIRNFIDSEAAKL